MNPQNNDTAIPSDGLAGLKQNWKSDLWAGFLVFLIALPLCLGISMASGFPPVGGIITAIIGGLIVGPVMGARLTIKGPAAGLIAIAAAAVIELGAGDPFAGYRYTLAIVVAAGLIQVIFALLKFGRFVDFFPASAVHGMMAAIGIIIIAKQVPVMLGVAAVHTEPLYMLAEIPEMFMRLNPEIAGIGLLSLLILIGLPLIKSKWTKKVPAPMVVLAVALPLGFYFDLDHAHRYLFLDHHYFVGPKFLVTLPENIADGITFPDFSHLFTAASVKYIIMFALVGSLESLLTVKAVEGMDPYRRRSDFNRDLLAVGGGNTLAGMIGGLPMIAEVVRSSANVGNGAQTRWSNVFHGLLLLVFVAFFPNVLHQIPLAALAAMLIYTGYRLASPALFKNAYKVGKEQLSVFLLTIVVTLLEDLLLGIAAGILLKIIFHLVAGVPLRQMFVTGFDVERRDTETIFKARSCAVFTNFIGFKRQIENVPPGRTIIVDFSNAKLVDHTFFEQLSHFRHDYESEGGVVKLKGLEQLEPNSAHELAVRKRRKEPKQRPQVNG
jgi:MFS superfamily sulfate permease-like transporter